MPKNLVEDSVAHKDSHQLWSGHHDTLSLRFEDKDVSINVWETRLATKSTTTKIQAAYCYTNTIGDNLLVVSTVIRSLYEHVNLSAFTVVNENMESSWRGLSSTANAISKQ